MSSPLGNPEESDPITITSAITTITITHGLASIEIQNTGNSNVAFGKASTLTYVRGGLIYAQGDRRTFENISAGWTISFRCDTGGTTILRRIDYK